MKFEFIGNAGGIFHGSKGTKILCDPWIVDGVFEGSWCHYPPLTTIIGDLQDVDAIYVSHLHPDHYDDRYFDFPKDIPIFALEYGPSFLIKILKKAGYNNIFTIKDKETISFKEFHITLFAPFTKHNFHEADTEIGNLIDSALVIENEDIIALNANDNTPTVEACKMLNNMFGHIDLAMINYNAAGPYPACFNNLSLEQKESEHSRIINRNFEYIYSLLGELNPKYALPFAGAYVLGGKLHDKNPYLGTTTWDNCANFLKSKNLPKTKVICLREKDIFDLSKGTSDKKYIPIDINHMKSYIKNDLAQLKYPYESDPAPDKDKLIEDLKLAAQRMLERSEKLGINIPIDISIVVDNKPIKLLSPRDKKGSLECYLDTRLLRRILDRQSSHWNNAEIGCHIEFVRNPNTYYPDSHTALQFLHL